MNQAGDAGISQRLAVFAAQTPATAVPLPALRAAARALLDAVGVMQAASALAPETQAFLAMARSGGVGPATVLGTEWQVPPALAALANGAMAHALDYEDAFDGAPLHPNASLIPAVLALVQAHRPVSGREMLAAIAIGCEVSCRLALCLRQPLEAGGWYPPPILGAWGAVAGAARIVHLTPRQLLDAWSLLLLQNSCAGEIKHDRDTVIRAVREAFPAQVAVQVAQLARAGVRGFDAPLEGAGGFFRLFAGGRFDADALLGRLGEPWQVEGLSFKPWPSCRGTHAAIECALLLRDALPDMREIRQIHVEGSDVQRMLAEPAARKQAPQSAIDAKFSLPFTVATALARGAVDLDSFTAGAREAPDVRAIAERVQFRQRDDWRGQAVSGAVEVHLAGGGVVRQAILVPNGAPSRPLAETALVSKFIDCTGRAARPLAAAAARDLAGRLLQLESEPDAGALPWTPPPEDGP